MGNSPKQREQSISRNFRIPHDVYRALEDDAAQLRTSLNSRVNQILYEHYFEPLPQMKEGYMEIAKSMIPVLTSKMTDEEAVRLGQTSTFKSAEAMITAKHGKITLEGVLEYLRDSARRAGVGSYSEAENGEKYIVTITHGLGRKASLALSTGAELLLQKAGLRPKITDLENMYAIELRSQDVITT